MYPGNSAHMGQIRDHKTTTMCELLSVAAVVSRIFVRAPGIPRQVDQIMRRRSPGEKSRVAVHGSQEQGAIGHRRGQAGDGFRVDAVAFGEDARVVDLKDT